MCKAENHSEVSDEAYQKDKALFNAASKIQSERILKEMQERAAQNGEAASGDPDNPFEF